MYSVVMVSATGAHRPLTGAEIDAMGPTRILARGQDARSLLLIDADGRLYVLRHESAPLNGATVRFAM